MLTNSALSIIGMCAYFLIFCRYTELEPASLSSKQRVTIAFPLIVFFIYSSIVMTSSSEVSLGLMKIILGILVAYFNLMLLRVSCSQLFELFRINNTAACGLIATTASSASAICGMALFL